jgi:hypothetical protein
MNNDYSALSFDERIKKESDGFVTLSKSFVEDQKRKEIGYWLKVSQRLGRPITDKEVIASNI